MFSWLWGVVSGVVGSVKHTMPAHGEANVDDSTILETGTHANLADSFGSIGYLGTADKNQGIADKICSPQVLRPPEGNYATIPDLTGSVESISEFPDYEATNSNVHRAVLNGEKVAVKIFRGRGVTPASKQRLMGDLRVWIKFSHKNILPLYGYCHDLGKQGALVSPWYENGNVGHYIRPEDPSRRVTPAQRFNLWCGVIEGLTYLHINGVVHGDLKPTNVLVDNEANSRVCDFGLAAIFSEGMVGATPTPVHSSTMRYLAYELIVAEDTVAPTKASDIYAAGCLALEIVFLVSPYAHRRNPAQIFRDVAKGYPPAQFMPIKSEPPPKMQEFWKKLNACWNTDAERRPSAQQLKEFVDRNREELVQEIGLFVVDT